MKKQQMRELTKDELWQRKAEVEEELFNLRLAKSTKQLDNPLKLRTLRRELARINTILQEDQLGVKALARAEEKTPKPSLENDR